MKKKYKNNTDYSLAHVLYQKLGTDWYAFTEVDGDCFMTKVDSETVDQAKLTQSQREEHERGLRSKRKAA
jgi:hypothetical protein